MANVIKPKRRFTSGVPSSSSLQQGEIAINLADKKLYSKDSSDNIVVIGSLNGSSTEFFKAKAGVASDDVVNKGQLDSKQDKSTLLTDIKAIDGSGSGLDADLLRGLPADFASSKSANGYQKLPGGLIIQWGTTTASSPISGTSTIVTLPLAFPSICVSAVATNTGGVVGNSTYNTIAKASSSFTVQRGNNGNIDSGINFNWIAIGY